MAISQVFKQFQLRQADDSETYHLLENELGDIEKGEDVETATPNLEHSVPSTAKNALMKKVFPWRWLRMLGVFMPSFLHPSAVQGKPKSPRPTAWLDGLRGVTALFVVFHHMSLIWFSWDIHNGWTDWNDHLIQLPIIRLVISGRPNVMIFFVISGYALSNKPLSLIRKGEYPKMYQGLASSIFRRHPRLFVPAVLICLPAWPIAYFGGFNGEAMPGAAIGTKNPPRFDTIWGQFGNYVTTLLALSDIYSPTDIDWAYSDSLWTLPIEFKGSLVIFTMLIALSRCTTRARVFITLGVAFYSFWYFHWGELLFIGGMLAVELGLRSQRSDRAERAAFDDAEVRRSKLFWSAPFRTKAFRRLCGIAAFLAALLILGMPEQGRGAPNSYGFKILSELIPAHFHAGGAADYFWRPLGAIFVVLVIDNVRFLQKIFTTRLAQYLGRVSFALYLVHMLILHSLGFWLGKYFLQLTGSESYWRYAAGVSLAALVDGCVTIWAADLGSRFVDAKAVRFTVWAYGKLCKRTVEK